MTDDIHPQRRRVSGGFPSGIWQHSFPIAECGAQWTTSRHRARHRRIVFIGKYVHRNISGGIGHSLPQEAPGAFANAVRRAVSL